MKNILQQLKTLQKAELAAYSPGLNSIKGILVLLVILSHALPLSLILFVIFFFHMPLFLSISGFLVKKSAFDNGIFPYLKKLVNRAIIPWLIAFVVYIPFSFYHRSYTTFSIYDIIYPYFHLWYVPAYVLGAVLCFWVIKFNIPTFIVLLFTTAITVAWFLIYRDPKLPIPELPVYFLGEKRFYSYLLFFFLGFALRNQLIKLRPNAILLLLFIGLSFIAIIGIIYKGQAFFDFFVLPYLILNISLIFFTIIYTSSQNWTQNKFIVFLNNQSLGLYLYHPMFVFMAYEYLEDPKMNQTDNLTGLFIFFITVALTSLLVWLFTQFEITNKYVLGNVKKLSA